MGYYNNLMKGVLVMTKLILIRHGEPDFRYVTERKFKGHGRDLAQLKQRGIEQAKAAAKGERLNGAQLIVSYPYTRALQTAAIEINNVKAILFDSGRTLNVPTTGHWFITPKFFNIINKSKLSCTEEQMGKAMEKACSHINKILFVKTEEQEFSMFKEFYEIVLREVNYSDIDNEIIELLAGDNVYNDEKFLFFDDVEPALIKLKEKYLLGVVSDTWPSLERVFINKNLRQYFSTFIMSSIYGSNKAEKNLFKIAIEELKIKPEEAVFIDDSESNLEAAEQFGMIPVLIDRYDTKDLRSKYPIIRSLNELLLKHR